VFEYDAQPGKFFQFFACIKKRERFTFVPLIEWKKGGEKKIDR